MSARLTIALTACLAAGSASATEPAPAKLAGHAFIPAMTMIEPPADAPEESRISGKFTGPGRTDEVGSLPGDTGATHGYRQTGLSRPFAGQPLQGFSGLAHQAAEDGSLYALIDNGFGNKRNSTDALLFFTKIAPNWDEGTVDLRETVFLSDPDRIIPFRIIHEATEERYLTGGDFDPESIQIVGDAVWIGEEFGPYLIRATLDGRVTGLFPTMLDGEELRGPDHPALTVPASPGADFRVQRSGGFEGMAWEPESRILWAMLEKPLLDADGAEEGRFLHVLAFDPEAAEWTGDSFKYPLEDGATAIGDFNFLDERRALVIERDNGEGDPSLACTGEPQADCFPLPAEFKRIVLVDTGDIAAEGFVRKLAHVDLMDISDQEGIARLETDAGRDLEGRFTFPFFTIENVRAMDDEHILVAVDNNLPFSSGRKLDAAADNEFILLSVPEFLAIR